MRVTIIPDDKIVLVDGEPIRFDFSIDPTIHAVQWDGQKGHIEFKSSVVDEKGRRKSNLPITDIAAFEPVLDQYVTEKIRMRAEMEVASVQRAKTQAEAEEKRKPFNDALELLKKKLSGKKLDEISDSEALDFIKISMADSFGLEIK